MFALETVLCPIDFSSATSRQVDFAADLCQVFDAKLIVHHNRHALASAATVGWMWIGRKKQLFLMEDVHYAALPPSPLVGEGRGGGAREQAPADFAAAFDGAFQRLDREHGGHNFVSLVELRRAVPAAQEAFDAGLRQLRLAGRYTLSAAEGRHGLTPEERGAGIVEDGALLLYVSRKG